MRKLFPIALSIILFAACKPVNPVDPKEDPVDPDEPKGKVVLFTESNEIFANPERGVLSQAYYTSADLNGHTRVEVVRDQRNSSDKMTLYLHSYYLTDYMESNIPKEFLDRLETNMNALREGGAKVVVRFSYKSSMDPSAKPWNATPEWIHKHIDQVAPYLQKHADVILCVQCGWLGSWGEWYYVDNGYKMNPTRDSDFEMRWELLEHYLDVVPESRQIALRIPAYKMRYLKMRGDSLSRPLTAAEAFKNTPKARICGHNDCFVSSSNDVGTFFKDAEREFWAEDTKYTFMGGETCEKCSSSAGDNAIKQMEKYHWTYINRAYRESVTGMWRADGTMGIMLRRLGYRLVLDKAVLTENPKAGENFEAYFKLRNVGFAAPINKRGLELILVSTEESSQKYVFPQEDVVDPRFWLPGTHKFTLSCNLADIEPGEYKLYLNLPDPYPSIHDNPDFSIRLANNNVWDETTGYNYIANITVE